MPSSTKPIADTPIRDAVDRALKAVEAQLPAEKGGFFQADASVASRGIRLQAGHRFTRTWAMSGWLGLAAGQRPEVGIRIHGTW